MNLEDYRREIDRINHEIVDLVGKRVNVAKEIGTYKEENDLDVVDEGREEKVKQQFEKLFDNEYLSPEKGREMAELLIEISTEAQK